MPSLHLDPLKEPYESFTTLISQSRISRDLSLDSVYNVVMKDAHFDGCSLLFRVQAVHQAQKVCNLSTTATHTVLLVLSACHSPVSLTRLQTFITRWLGKSRQTRPFRSSLPTFSQ
jgi:hypothetical protein